MRWEMRSVIAVILCGVLISTSPGISAQVAPKTARGNPSFSSALHKELQRPYLELFRQTASLEYTPAEILR